MAVTYAAIAGAAARHGLLARGGFHPEASDGLPASGDEDAVATVVLLGNAGTAMWPVFQQAPEARDGKAHGIDRWCRRVIAGLAEQFGGLAVFPFDGPPYLPFQRWARRAEPVAPSPLGILIHPDYGLWHAYRGALLFAERLDLPAPDNRPSPCESCRDKPCLSTCPVGAFSREGYDVKACRAYLDTPAGGDCIARGCLARRACPVGRAYLYEPGQAAWHMRAFHRGSRVEGR